jgi:hypothetical protein
MKTIAIQVRRERHDRKRHGGIPNKIRLRRTTSFGEQAGIPPYKRRGNATETARRETERNGNGGIPSSDSGNPALQTDRNGGKRGVFSVRRGGIQARKRRRGGETDRSGNGAERKRRGGIPSSDSGNPALQTDRNGGIRWDRKAIMGRGDGTDVNCRAGSPMSFWGFPPFE